MPTEFSERDVLQNLMDVDSRTDSVVALRRILYERLNTALSSLSSAGVLTWAVPPRGFGWIDVKAYGATGDGSTDDTTALQSALTAAEVTALTDGVNVLVFVPAGTYQITGQLIVPYGVRLVGAGARSTRIRVASTFSALTSTGAIRLGRGTAAVFGCSIEQLMLECSGIAGSIGIYSTDVQDNSGVRNVLVNNFRSYGIRFDGASGTFGSVNGFFIQEVECYKNAADGTSGVGISIETGTFGGNIQRVVVSGAASNGLTTGIQILNSPAYLVNISTDIAGTNGVLFSTSSSGAISGLVTNGFTNSVRITTSSRVICTDIHRVGGTNTINDDGTGATAATITSGIWPLYVRGENIRFDGFTNTGRKIDSAKTLTDGASVSVDASAGFLYRLSAGGSRTINGPSNATDGQEITIEILNNTGGAITTTFATGGGQYVLGSAWTDPAAGKRRAIGFRYNSTVDRWYEIYRTGADV